jgi:diaminopimelate epimerase
MTERAGGAIAFEKWEGLGNDFVLVVAGASLPLASAEALETKAIVAICDRRRGVGADGILVVEGLAGGRPRMVVFNADGSRPEMCGNGLRCVAAYVAASGGAAPGDERTLGIDTDAGLRRCVVQVRGAGLFDVEVDMGAARLDGELRVALEGAEHRFRRVDMGNPHAVTFVPYDEATIDRVAPRIATAPADGVNVEFCAARPAERDAIDVIVWERGVGRTLACGTGACAVAAAACEEGRVPFGAPVRVGLPGGELVIRVEAGTRAVSMRGPARRVFRGQLAPG